MRGTEHVLVAHLAEGGASAGIADLAAWAREIGSRLKNRLPVVAVTGAEEKPNHPGVASFHDREGTVAAAYGPPETAFLIRPDGYIGWRGRAWREPGLLAYLDMILQPERSAQR